MARTAAEAFGLQKVVFLPCSHSPLKKVLPVAGDLARIKMLRSGLRGQTWAEVSDWEIRRGGVSYTIDTILAWEKRDSRASLFWIMGSDQWAQLPSWKNPRELRRKGRFLVFPRPEKPRKRPGFFMKEIPFRIDLSATEIRQRLRQGQAIRGMVLPAVELLIRRNGWYR